MNIGLVFVALVVLLFVLWWGSQRLMGKQIDQAKRQGTYPVTGEKPTMAHVLSLAKSGQKILAIKLYREIHGVGLKEAKDEVERLMKA